MVLEILSRILEHFTGSVTTVCTGIICCHYETLTEGKRKKILTLSLSMAELQKPSPGGHLDRVDGDYRMWRAGTEKSAANRLGGED